MKQIKAFIHRNRTADVVAALQGEGYNTLTVVDVKGMLDALDRREQGYSVELGVAAITEVKLELICEDDRVEQAVAIIREKARTGQAHAGWVYVIDVARAYPIE